MQYCDFGKTGHKISRLGFGALHFPRKQDFTVDHEKAVSVIHRALDLGVNFIDSAFGYLGGESEIIVGKALKGRRNQAHIQTKADLTRLQPHETYRGRLEKALNKLQTDYIDFYLIHSLRAHAFEQFGKAWLEMAHNAKDEGLIKHIGLSSHDNPDNILKFIETNEFECILVQYNLLDRRNEGVIRRANEKAIGVSIMGPIGGGRLAEPSEEVSKLLPGKVKSTAQIALRFVLSNPNVHLALSGMSSIPQVEENAAVASRQEPLTQEEHDRIQAALKEKEKLADLYCTGCNYCLPCQQGVAIPTIFQLMNYYRLYGLIHYAREQYASLGPQSASGDVANACIQCGECEDKCPQNIPIPQQLKEAAEILGR